jgi:NAD(P)-dependent dehydrogenase (short-subunit alcohol dehydrogenase family)
MSQRHLTVVTGGAGGMGVACARRLGERGPVVLADLPGERLDAAVAALRSEGIDAEGADCDVSDPGAVGALAERAGKLGVLVHTAGLAPPLATDPRAILDVNLAGTALVLDAFEPRLQPGSVAVCVASMGGYRKSAGRYDDLLSDLLAPGLLERLDAAGAIEGNALKAYALSKRGVILECRRRAAAWGRRGARIVSISPGLIADTAIGEGAMSIHAGAYATQAAVGRAGTAADVAGVVAFLASADAAYVTGCDILVDGGVLADIAHHQDERTRAAWHGPGD